ncbi:methylenetetrahydrofolate--tRNA-(uracil-5-)-methyltransferase TrmFO [Striga asiatica]|uniref:Methylenetetrahydrofolate--tRNA-(Uracil-5-)-methyltransferase TrmFO n=1 Tax=Striga asiatica TaxID=4170 RepID=A0A5A7RDZ9_STRAF|nr:methylenetetrahydrofolate--tRNA-(uracil-5-)-methyltransferase TrmFO [Striga asiatica]
MPQQNRVYLGQHHKNIQVPDCGFVDRARLRLVADRKARGCGLSGCYSSVLKSSISGHRGLVSAARGSGSGLPLPEIGVLQPPELVGAREGRFSLELRATPTFEARSAALAGISGGSRFDNKRPPLVVPLSGRSSASQEITSS